MSEARAELRQTALAGEHRAAGARLTEFAGWLMPLSYAGIVAEHQWTRTQCSVFDVGHMGEFIVTGAPEDNGLEYALTPSLARMQTGSCRYGFLLAEENGGILDDLIVYKLDCREWMVVVNAATTDSDARHLSARLRQPPAFTDISSQTEKIDIQGPAADDVVRDVLGINAAALAYYRAGRFPLAGESVVLSRTGYTGERGFELYCSPRQVCAIWRRLLADARVRPAGLGCRDTLRLEMGFLLSGQDFDCRTTPLEADAARFIDWDKDFIGRAALRRQQAAGTARRLVALKTTGRRAPRPGFGLYAGSQQVGAVSSGTFSPSLACGIALGYVACPYSEPGGRLLCRDSAGTVEIETVVAPRPLYRPAATAAQK